MGDPPMPDVSIRRSSIRRRGARPGRRRVDDKGCGTTGASSPVPGIGHLGRRSFRASANHASRRHRPCSTSVHWTTRGDLAPRERGATSVRDRCGSLVLSPFVQSIADNDPIRRWRIGRFHSRLRLLQLFKSLSMRGRLYLLSGLQTHPTRLASPRPLSLELLPCCQDARDMLRGTHRASFRVRRIARGSPATLSNPSRLHRQSLGGY